MGGDWIGTDLVQLSTGVDYIKLAIDVASGLKPKFELLTIPKKAVVRLIYDFDDISRYKMIENDYVDAVIGLGKNLFYNSSMESCLLVCRMKKTEERKGKIIFINAREELRIERTNAWLEPHNITKISNAYWDYKNVEGFAHVIPNKLVAENNGNLSVQLYVKQAAHAHEQNTAEVLAAIKSGQKQINSSLEDLFTQLTNIGINS